MGGIGVDGAGVNSTGVGPGLVRQIETGICIFGGEERFFGRF